MDTSLFVEESIGLLGTLASLAQQRILEVWQWLVLAKKFLAITREPIQLSYLGKARLAFANKARQSLPENQVLLIDMYEQLHSSHQAYIQYQLKYKLDIQLITTKHI
jgi:hypothetical protein